MNYFLVSSDNMLNYRPQTEFAKVIFSQASVILLTGGGCAWFYLGGHAWFYSGGACIVLLRGGMRGFIQGGMRGFIWGGIRGFIQGGMHGFIWGGMHGVIWGGVHGFIWGACVVLLGGGMCGFSSFFGYNEIRSMSGRYASYWNAFLW